MSHFQSRELFYIVYEGAPSGDYMLQHAVKSYSSLMMACGVQGASGREPLMCAGGAERASERGRLSQGSSASVFIVLNFFLRFSSLIFFLGRDRSKSAEKETRNIIFL